MDQKSSLRIGIDGRLWRQTGVGRYIQNLIIELSKSGSEHNYVLFVRSEDKEDIRSKINNSQIKLVEADVRWHSLKEQFVFPFILYQSQCDLIHFPYFSVPIFYFKPFVMTIHDMITWQFATGKASTLPFWVYWLKQLVYRFIVFIAAQRAKKIITVSESTKKEITKYLHVSLEKVVVTYEGVEKGFTEHGNSLPNIIMSDSKFFLCVGNAYPHKNFERLVDAFHMFINSEGIPRQARDNIKLIFVGNNNYFYDQLKKSVANKKIPNVIFTGFVSDASLGSFYQHSIATVIPSLMEGFGLPALEAMAEKCVVIASDIPVLKEICDDIPFYFDPKSTESIAQKLDFVYKAKKSLLDIKKEKGFALVKNFSWKKMTDETLYIYESSTRIRQNK